MISDDPIVSCMERTGYAPWNQYREPICPVCGEPCETIYRDSFGYIRGCNVCMEALEASEVTECFER